MNSTRIGDLLVQAGILTQAQLADAARTAKNKRAQIGQVLVMTGLISPRDLQSALEAQSMLRDKSVDLNEALRCLKISYKLGSPFKDILSEYVSPKKTQTSKLGELLVESGLVSYELLAQAVEQSNSTGLPLGRMLVLHKIISNDVLQLALDLQVRVRDEMMSRQEAINALREKAGLSPLDSEAISASKIKPAEPARRKGLRIGELMVMAGILTETDVMNALEWGLVNQKPIGQVLVSQRLISEEHLEAALAVQKLVDKENLEPLKASECLARIFENGVSIEEALSEMRAEKDVQDKAISYEKLLTLASVLNEDELEEAFDMSNKTAAVIGKILVLTGHMDVPTLQCTLRCFQLFSRGYLTADDAVVTLDYALHHKNDAVIKFDEALRQLGWSKERGLRLLGEPGMESRAATPTESAAADATESGALSELPPYPALNEKDERPIVQADTRNIPEMAADESVSNISLAPDAPLTDVDESEPGASYSGTATGADAESGAEADSSLGAGADGDPTKIKRHSQTIQPEDARASRLANLMKGQKAGDKDILEGFDPSGDPPDALHRVFEKLAHSYFGRGNYPQAQVIYERILVHRLNQLGPNDVALVMDLNNLGAVLVAQEKFNQAEPFMRRALTILEKAPGSQPVKIADALSLLATIYAKQDKLQECEPLLKRALELRRATLSTEHPDIAQTLSEYAKLLRKIGREAEAEEMYREALAILAKFEAAHEEMGIHGDIYDAAEEGAEYGSESSSENGSKNDSENDVD
jgi:tetratricopeptide (TPR) repeat protein